MNYPIVLSKARNLGYKFMVAEAFWILSGRNDVEFMDKFSNKIKDFSDDGIFFNGAYGPKIIDQLPYIVECLHSDPCSRQAIINIWREKPSTSKDIPCTLGVQFLIRGDKLYCIDTMRSSDIWLGWPYDIFNFSMLSNYVIYLLYKIDPKFKNLKLGTISLNAGSQHIYESDLEKIKECIKDTDSNIIDEKKFEFDANSNIIDYLDAVLHIDRKQLKRFFYSNLNLFTLTENKK